MIVRPRRGFLPLLLTLQGSVLPAVMPQVILVASLAAAAFAVHEIFPNYFPNYGLAPFSILGLMLSLLLGFRNNASNPADQVLRLLSLEIAKAQQQGQLADILVTTFEARITAMTEIQAACERLHNTPIPFAYMLLVHRTAYLFCFLLPFGLVASVGISAPFISALVAYAFFGLDALSEELEEPFGERPNQLPLFAIERTIEINVLEAQGLPTPEPLKPQGYWLN